jgi:adenosylmethionine-8-amino-7-oxononanoate aminotransferase
MAVLRDRLGAHPHVADIRGRGLFQAVEFVADRDTLAPFDPAVQFAARLKRVALAHGLAVYPSSGTIDGRRGDHAIVAPPYNATADDIDRIADRLAAAVDATVTTIR